MQKKNIFYYIEQIQKHKIYDIDWSTVCSVQSAKIKKMLSEESTILKTYEKKFLKKEKIYVDEIKIADYKHFFEESGEEKEGKEKEKKEEETKPFLSLDDEEEEDWDKLMDIYEKKEKK